MIAKNDGPCIKKQSHLTRRRFLSSAAAAAGTVAILKSPTVWGAKANSKARVGVVGQGGRGSWIARLFAEHGGFQVTALADYFDEVVQERGEALGVEKKHRYSGLAGYKNMIASGAIDAIALETPPWFFPQHAAAAVDAGLHVYVAKPVACDVPGCQTIAQLGKRSTENKRCFLVDFQTRAHPFFQEAVRRVHAGALEKITMMKSYYIDDGFPDPPLTKTIESRLRGLVWVNDVALGGSYIVNCDIHALDVALWVAGAPPTRALGSSRVGRENPHGDSRDSYSITYEFPSGAILSHYGDHVNNLSGFQAHCTAYGRQSFFEGNYEGKVWIRGGEMAYKGGEIENLYQDGAKTNIDTFHKNITGGDFSNPTVEPSVQSTLMTILGREAGRMNGAMTWDELIRENKRLPLDLSGLRE